MIDERINDHLQRINQYLLQLKKIKEKKREDFIKDSLLIAAVERLFQLSIESCINIGNRILSIEQFNKTITSPETYSDVFRGLGKIGVVETEFVDTLVLMAKFRNRLVHLYWQTEPEELYNFLQNNLNDFERFIKAVVEYYHPLSDAMTI